MSVYIHKHEDHQGFGHGGHNEKKCSMCNGLLFYPFLGWPDTGCGIFLCAKCCNRWRKGLVADLIHCSAIFELNYLGYSETFVRTHHAKLDAKAKKEQEELDTIDKELKLAKRARTK